STRCGPGRVRLLGLSADCASASVESAVQSGNRSDEESSAELLCHGYSGAATVVLGSPVSTPLLGGSEAVFDAKPVGSLPGGVTDPAGVGIQSGRRLACQRAGVDAVAA